MYDRLRRYHTQLSLSDLLEPPHCLDHRHLGHGTYNPAVQIDVRARQEHERLYPTPLPFEPITHRRVRQEKQRRELELQEQQNMPQLLAYGEQIRQHKHHWDAEGLSELFAMEQVDDHVPPGTIAYHQIAHDDLKRGDGTGSVHNNWSLEQHMALMPGDYVHYRHIRSSTTRSWWLQIVSHRTSKLNDSKPETAIRLELAPKRGIYITHETMRSLDSHLHEDELVLPADTYWRVVGIGDAVIPTTDIDESSSQLRLRAVQMAEIDPHEIDPRRLRVLTRIG